MSSPPFDATIDLALRPSLRALSCLFWLHVGVLVLALVALRTGPVLALLALAMAGSWFWTRRHPAFGHGRRALTRLTWHAEGAWTPLPKTSDPVTSLNTYESNDDHSDDLAPSGMNDMRSKVTSCQWARTLWLIQNYGLKATNVTESMYTMGMDVCESGGRRVQLSYKIIVSLTIESVHGSCYLAR